MHVVATAGHVDHGKSTLVRALTGMEPDRWAEERRRGMTIDLGFVWTTLPSGAQLAFVDVPGHARFIGTMLAGLGPAPAVLVVVAADEGWRAQSAEHLAAVDALGLTHGLLAVTRSDLADPGPATAQAREQIARSSLGAVPAVAVSGATGAGLDRLRELLQRLAAQLPAPDLDAPVRLWIDRAFTIRGSGTVVTGTLGAGRLRRGDRLLLGDRPVTVRGLQSLGDPTDAVDAVARVAVNLRGVEVGDVRRGDALTTPDAWPATRTLDVHLDREVRVSSAVLHVGSAALGVHVRVLGDGAARLTLPAALPLHPGDRAVLRDPGRQELLGGLTVLDADPPPLTRRGAARRRAAELAAGPDPAAELARRGAVRHDGGPAAPGAVVRAGWAVDPQRWARWRQALLDALDARARDRPMDPALPDEQARAAIGAPDRALVRALAGEAGLACAGGRIARPGAAPSLGAAEPALRRLEQRLGADPFAAPERPELDELGLGTRELATAVRTGRLLRLAADVFLLPDAPQRAARTLGGLAQPFTTSQARQALGTSRRVAVPLLEHLDALGLTVRDGNARTVPGPARVSD